MRVSINTTKSTIPEVDCPDESLEALGERLNKTPKVNKLILLNGRNGQLLVNLSNIVSIEVRK